MASTHLSLHYHFVFSTKNREPWLAPTARRRVHEYIGGIIRSMNGIAHAVGGTGDHIHIAAGLRATHCLADVKKMPGIIYTINHAKNLAARCTRDGCCKCKKITVKFELDDINTGASQTGVGYYKRSLRGNDCMKWNDNGGGKLNIDGADPDPHSKSSLPEANIPADAPLPFSSRQWSFPVPALR